VFLGKRYWAEKAVRAAGVPAGDPVGVELADMLVSGAEQFQHKLRTTKMVADDLDFTVMTARIMPTNATALRRVRDRYALPEDTARRMLFLVRDAAFDIFAAEGRQFRE
jgi:hypothetical protein